MSVPTSHLQSNSSPDDFICILHILAVQYQIRFGRQNRAKRSSAQDVFFLLRLVNMANFSVRVRGGPSGVGKIWKQVLRNSSLRPEIIVALARLGSSETKTKALQRQGKLILIKEQTLLLSEF